MRNNILALFLAWGVCGWIFAEDAPSQNDQAAATPAIPVALEKYRGVHPRLFLDANGVDAMRVKIAGTHKALWDAFIKEADEIAKTQPDAYQTDPGEQLWQRKVGNKIATLAFAWLISKDKKYLDAASAWATASCNYPTWGLIPPDTATTKSGVELWQMDGKKPTGTAPGVTAQKGLVYGHQLLGLAMLYDYAYSDLDPATRDLIRRTIVTRAHMQYPAFKARYAYLQNHSWVNGTGLLASGLVLFDEEPEAAKWIELPENILKQSNKMLSPDGASQEGFGYWQYGVEYLLKLMELSKLTGDDQFASPWWDKTADYCLYMMLPRHAWDKAESQNDYCDAARFTWYGPDYLLRALASRNHDGVAQWLAGAIDDAKVETSISPWLNLLWYDPAVAPTPPDAQPTLRYFDNMGLVSSRSDWSGDESVLFFKAGNPLGKFAPDNFPTSLDPWDIGHVHRDSNHFCLFGDGEWLLRNSTYANRDAKFHNTLVVGGVGQLGDDRTTVQPLKPGQDFAHILEANSTPDVDRISGVATNAYPPKCGVTKFVRHLIFLKPNVLIVADDIEVKDSQKLDLYFHPEAMPVAEPDGTYEADGKKAVLCLEVLTPDGVVSSITSQVLSASHSTAKTIMPAIIIEKVGTSWRSAVALSWARAGQKPATVTLTQKGTEWTFAAGDKHCLIDWDALKSE